MKKITGLASFICIFFIAPVYAQLKTDNLLQNILSSNKSPVVRQVLGHKDMYRVQVIYTQINRDKDNHPSFKNYYFNAGNELYFNPASTVKFPLALLALEKLNKMHIPGVDKFTALQYDSNYSGQVALQKDSTSANGLPSIAHFIKKAFLISDNDAYNRLYEFTGQQTINRGLHENGYPNIRITRQFMRLSPVENRHTNPIRFIHEDGSLIYAQVPAYNTDSFDFSHTVKLGKAFYNRDDSLINEPMDFTAHNNLPLEDLQQLLQSVLFPSSVPARQRFDLTNTDYHFLYEYLSQFPSETNYPKYDTSIFYDSYVKFFFRNSSHQMPSSIRVFNKVGWAYGFLTDVSYVVDFKNKTEFMLSVDIYVNSDDILNDNKYDYDSIGWPFLYEIGQTIYQYELKRKRMFRPRLDKFMIQYEHRNKNDVRPSIKDVDN
jgi:hypothetical protein